MRVVAFHCKTPTARTDGQSAGHETKPLRCAPPRRVAASYGPASAIFLTACAIVVPTFVPRYVNLLAHFLVDSFPPLLPSSFLIFLFSLFFFFFVALYPLFLVATSPPCCPFSSFPLFLAASFPLFLLPLHFLHLFRPRLLHLHLLLLHLSRLLLLLPTHHVNSDLI